MRKAFFILVAVLSLVWAGVGQGVQQGGPAFSTQSISGTAYVAPRLQVRFSSQRFNPPMVFDIGGTAATQNIFQIVPLTTANTTTFAVVPMNQATKVSFPDPGASSATVGYLEAAQTFSGNNIFSGLATFTGSSVTLGTLPQLILQKTGSQLAIGSGGHVVTVSFTAPAAASQTYVFPDFGGNANLMARDATTVQNLLANAFQVTDPTDTTKDIAFAAAGATTSTKTTLTFAQTSNRTITFPDNTVTLTGVIASGTSTLASSAIGAGACGTATTTAATNVATTDAIEWAYASAPTTADGELPTSAWVTAGNVNFKQCNSSAGSLTPSGLVINWRVIR
jgi:hypothetical protein